VDIAVIGLGLIGGSLLRALAAAGHRVWGYDTDPATRATARTAAAQAPARARWQVTGALPDTVAGAGLVVVAVPLPAVAGVFDGLAAAGYAGLVTDVTSVKAPVRDLAAARLPSSAGFVGGHPMAGRETSGFAATDPDLFTGCAWGLCLERGTSMVDWLALADLYTRLGARIVPTTAEEHDRAVAAVSHVPHLLAAALAASVAGDPLAQTLAAGSFRDGTRVAAGSPELIASMCAGNPAAVAPALAVVRDALAGADAALATDDPIGALRAWLVSGARVRTGWPPRPGSRRELPADREVLLRLGRAGGWLTTVAGEHVTAVLPGSPADQGESDVS
jgi:prephenate dehydrogenase